MGQLVLGNLQPSSVDIDLGVIGIVLQSHESIQSIFHDMRRRPSMTIRIIRLTGAHEGDRTTLSSFDL